jgi:hypothetical protein
MTDSKRRFPPADGWSDNKPSTEEPRLVGGFASKVAQRGRNRASVIDIIFVVFVGFGEIIKGLFVPRSSKQV